MAVTGTSTVEEEFAGIVAVEVLVTRNLGSPGSKVTSTLTGHGKELRTRTGKLALLLMRLTALEDSTDTEELKVFSD